MSLEIPDGHVMSLMPDRQQARDFEEETADIVLTHAGLDHATAEAWDSFVTTHPEGTFCHLFGWRHVIVRAFGHACFYLMVRRKEQIIGVLPLVHVKTPLFGNGLISTGFCVYGGPLVTEPAAADILDRAAISLRDKLGADFLEYRNLSPAQPDWLQKSNLYVTFRREILPSRDDNLKAIPRKQRAVVRKALTADLLTLEYDNDIERFWQVYSTSVRNLGTPIFTKRFFLELKQVFKEQCEIAIVKDETGAAIATVMSFLYGDCVMPYFGGGLPAARKYGAFDFMYWSVMERARERGFRQFDFGRSKVGTGAFAFKKNWGFKPTPLSYAYAMAGEQPLPDVNPLNPKYRMMIATWKHLPLPVANLIGPWVARGLG